MNKSSSLIIAAVLALAGAGFASASGSGAYADLINTGVQKDAADIVTMKGAPQIPAIRVENILTGKLYYPPGYVTGVCENKLVKMAGVFFSEGIAILIAPPSALALSPKPVSNGCSGGFSIIYGNTLLGLPSANWPSYLGSTTYNGEINIVELQSLLNVWRNASLPQEALELFQTPSGTVAYSVKISPWR